LAEEASPSSHSSKEENKNTNGVKRANYRALANEIRFTARLASLGLVFSIATSLAIPLTYIALGGWREAMTTDRPATLLVWPFQFLGVLTTLAALSFHLKKTVDRIKLRKRGVKVSSHPVDGTADSKQLQLQAAASPAPSMFLKEATTAGSFSAVN